MAELMIEADKEQWEALVNGISGQTAQILQVPPVNVDEANALVAFVNTLKSITESVADYLPPGARTHLQDVCGSFMDIGRLFGQSPRILLDILERSGAKVVKADDDTKGDET